jgi:hypothetical protein
MTKRQIVTEAERLEKYLFSLPIPCPTDKELEQVLSRPCKWRRILEERNKDPDGAGYDILD